MILSIIDVYSADDVSSMAAMRKNKRERRLEQSKPASRQFLERPAVILNEHFGYSFIEFPQRKERPMPQRRENPALHVLHALLDLRLVLRLLQPCVLTCSSP